MTSVLAVSLLGSLPVAAFSPRLQYVSPVAVQGGTKATLHFHGERLDKAKEALFYEPGISALGNPTVHSPKHISFEVELKPETPLGMHAVRLRCDDGITYQKTFTVTPYPIVEETGEANDSTEQAQPIHANISVHGVIKNEDVDYYSIDLKPGQQLSTEIAGMRLGHTFFDPHLTILGPDGREIASSDDTPLTKQDPYISITAKQEGKYFVLVRESSYEGSDSSHYILHIGHFPRPAAIYPPGAIEGQETSFQFINTDGSTLDHTATPSSSDSIYATAHGLTSPTPVPLRVNNLPYTNEKEPNNGSKETLEASTLPCAFHGIISKPGDVDWFKFHAEKDQYISIIAYARSQGSPLDGRLILRDAEGKQLATNDDSNNYPDPKIDFKTPAKGDYYINIRDHLDNAGANYIYRIEITPRKASISASINRSDRTDSQKRKTINIPRGGRLAYQLNISRDRTSSPVTVSADKLPTGVTLRPMTADKGENNMLLYFEANAEAPLSGGLYPISVESSEHNLKTPITEEIEHIGVNNQGVYCSYKAEQLAIAVMEESPFDIALSQPATPAVLNGTLDLKVKINRKNGYDKEVTFFLPWLPPGITAPGTVTIPKDRDTAIYRLSIKGDAPVKNWQLCVSATSGTKDGSILLSSNLIPITIKEPYLTAKIEMAATIPGKAVSIPCKVEHSIPFQGEAIVTLHGLPDGFTAQPVKITSATTETMIPVELSKEARTGNHGNLFCHIEVPENGHSIAHNTGHGGSLRVNDPPKNQGTAKNNSKKSPPSNKPLSRLEQLRQETK